MFAGLLAALVGMTLLFGGLLAPGAPPQHVYLTEWRLPGLGSAPLPIFSAFGVEFLLRDACAMLAVWVAGALLVRREGRRTRALFAFFTALFVVSWGLLTCVQIGDAPEEGHRLMTAVMLATPLFGLGWLVRARTPGGRHGRVIQVLVPLLVVAALGSSAASTLRWRITQGPKRCDSPIQVFSTEDFHTMDCRERYGARLGETPHLRYAARPLAYGYEGCHPVFAPTSKQPGQYWAVATGMPTFEYEALGTLQTMLGKTESLAVTCPPGGLAGDPLCPVQPVRKCEAEGTGAVTCLVSAGERRAILARQPRGK